MSTSVVSQIFNTILIAPLVIFGSGFVIGILPIGLGWRLFLATGLLLFVYIYLRMRIPNVIPDVFERFTTK